MPQGNYSKILQAYKQFISEPKMRENTINLSLTCRDKGHHQHQHLIPMILGLWMIRMQQRFTPACTSANPQDCGLCCFILMFLTFCISELSILKHSALCPLSPRCKPPPCASLWVSVALLCWAVCLHPRCTSSFSSPRRTWSLTDSTSTGSASVAPGPPTPSVSNKAATFLWACGEFG